MIIGYLDPWGICILEYIIYNSYMYSVLNRDDRPVNIYNYV